MITKLLDQTKKTTANRLAKEIIIDRLDLVDYVFESFNDCGDLLTDKEREAVNKAVSRQVDRVIKFLNM